MSIGKRRRRPTQTSMWVATQDLPLSAAHPFYMRLNQILDEHDFDEHVEGLCNDSTQTMAGQGCHPAATSGLLIGYFEGLDTERAIAWRAADSFALRELMATPCA